MFRFTFDSICEIAFGINLDSMDNVRQCSSVCATSRHSLTVATSSSAWDVLILSPQQLLVTYLSRTSVLCASLAAALSVQDNVVFAQAFDIAQEYFQRRFVFPTWR